MFLDAGIMQKKKKNLTHTYKLLKQFNVEKMKWNKKKKKRLMWSNKMQSLWIFNWKIKLKFMKKMTLKCLLK